MTKDQLLEQAIAHFSRSRTTRLKQKEPTPKALKLRAIGLLDHYSKGQVCEILNLSPSALSQWQRELTTPETSDFVQLPALLDLPSNTDNKGAPYVMLTLTLPKDIQVELSGDLSCDFVLSLIKGLGQ